MSINLLGPGDSAVQLEQGTDKDAVNRKPWMAASVQTQYKQLFFKFIKATNLPQMDTFGTIDAYVYLEWNKSKLRTETVTMKDNLIEWKQEMMIPLELPASNDEIAFKVYDHDTTFDELVATFRFSIK